MEQSATILLSRKDVTKLLTVDECITAVENAFRLHAEGKTPPPKVLGIHSENGGLHIKAAMMDLQRTYFVAKLNANFPGNFKQYRLPTIQGIIAVFDATDGRLLALMDSIEITILRTGAATAVAAKYLSIANSKVITICGCGNQGKISIKAIMKIRRIEKVFAFDINKEQAGGFAKQLGDELKIPVTAVDDLAQAVRQSDICITCTPSTKPFLGLQHTVPGIFIAAVGADSEHKQELCPDLVCSAKLVVDLKEQCATIGELHHALDGNFMKLDDVYADLGEIVAGKKSGRNSGDEIIIFDSTGTALQDAVAAALVYERALKNGKGIRLNLVAENDREEQIQKKNQRDSDALSGFYPFR